MLFWRWNIVKSNYWDNAQYYIIYEDEFVYLVALRWQREAWRLVLDWWGGSTDSYNQYKGLPKHPADSTEHTFSSPFPSPHNTPTTSSFHVFSSLCMRNMIAKSF